MSEESIFSSLEDFAKALADPGGYEPERLLALSYRAPDPLSTFIEAALSSDGDLMHIKLRELSEHALRKNSSQAWFDLGVLAHRFFFNQTAAEYYERSLERAVAEWDLKSGQSLEQSWNPLR
jgi:hypothetical protein